MRRPKLQIIVGAVAACVATMHIAAAAEGLGRVIGHKSSGDPRCGEVVLQDVSCKVCKPVPDKKKVTKIVYECKEEWYCLPQCPCPLHIGKHDCCDSSGATCPTCEKPRCRRVLIKKIVTEEKPTTKCVVETVTDRTP